jgi:DNA-cytosine methyltransferase
MKKLNVLSLFDGISAGQVALERSGIEVENYYASEIDKYAIQVTNKNHPNTIQLGSVTDWNKWDIDFSKIDMAIGGSPCQGFSFAGKQLNFEDSRSKLFFDFVNILNHIRVLNPNVKFLLENVRMKKEYQDVISKYMGVEPIQINSSTLSGQNRLRLYWTNIENVIQPEDKGVLLRDIILEDVEEKYYLTAEAVDYMSRLRNGKPRWEYHKNPIDGKAACLTANMYKGVPYGVLRIPEATKKGYVELNENEGIDLTHFKSETRRGRLMKDKSNCLTVNSFEYCWYDGYIVRKLTPIECERLQTFPDNYTEMLLSKNILYIYSETNLIKVWQKNAESKNANQISQVKPLNYATSIILDLLELELLTKELWQTKRNVHTQLAQKTQKQNKDTVSYTTIDGLDMEAQNCLIEILKKIKNVNIVMQPLEKKEVEQEECVVNITKTGLDMEMLYSQIVNGVKLGQEDTMAKLVVKIGTGLYLKISWEDPLNLQRSFIILTLIKQIIISKIYTYVKTKVNIKAVISNLELLPQNCLKVELLDFQMESISLNSNTQRYKALGNSWTVDVVSHIFNNLKE